VGEDGRKKKAMNITLIIHADQLTAPTPVMIT
jgi:hypothetical protein